MAHFHVERLLRPPDGRYATSIPGLGPALLQLWERLTFFRQGWPQLRERLREQLLPLAELRHRRCPTRPEHIGLDEDQMRGSYLAARHIRRRYKVFDIVQEAGLLNDFVEKLFSLSVYWSSVKGA